MKKIINVKMEKEMYNDVKTLVNFKNVTVENNVINADVDEIQFNIALHRTGWSQSDDFEYIYKIFTQTIEKLAEFRTLLDDEYIKAMMSNLDIGTFIHDSESLQKDIKDMLYLFEF